MSHKNTLLLLAVCKTINVNNLTFQNQFESWLFGKLSCK